MINVLSINTISILSIITAAGLVLFWIGFFTIGLAPANPPAGYFVYEHSFPVPDIILAIVLIAGSILNMTGGTGTTLLVAGGGALVFLGILDISFNFQNGMYKISVMDMILNAFINLWCVLFGAAIVVRMM
jgi:hypothetical protein